MILIAFDGTFSSNSRSLGPVARLGAASVVLSVEILTVLSRPFQLAFARPHSESLCLRSCALELAASAAVIVSTRRICASADPVVSSSNRVLPSLQAPNIVLSRQIVRPLFG